MSWLSTLSAWWQAPSAWLIGIGCVILAARQARRLTALEAPQPERLLRELLEEVAPFELDEAARRRALVAELNERLSDVAFQLELLPARFTALTRIALASGSGLALVGYIGSSDRPALERVVGLSACAVAGLVAAGLVATLGRTAKAKAAQLRQNWDRASRDTGTSLGIERADRAR